MATPAGPKGIRKIVLAYSGGLDTSVILRWLVDTYGAEVWDPLESTCRHASLSIL